MDNNLSSVPTFSEATLIDLLRKRALQQPRQVAYTFLVDGETEEVSLTYQALDQKARSLAANLQSMKATGERALLLYPPGLEFIAAFFGCLYAGVVAVPVPLARRKERMTRLQAIMADAQATFALTTTSVLTSIEHSLKEELELSTLCCIATDNITYDLASDWQASKVSSDILAFLQYTSGSTATPKGVMVSHKNLLHNQLLIEQAFQHTQETIFVGWLPLYHDMGLIGNVLQPLYLGMPCILMSPIAFLERPLRWLQAISRYKGTTSGGPNFAYDLCVSKITPSERSTLDLSSWEVAFNGADSVRAETIERFTNAFSQCGFLKSAFYPCYGLAEATLLVSGGLKASSPVVQAVQIEPLKQNQVILSDEENNKVQKFVGCGKAILDQQIVIVHPETLTRCSPAEVGEIWVSGSSVAQGYWRRPTETESTFCAYLQDTDSSPFLRTGDLGFLKDGELFVTGRLKDIIVIRGSNHYPQDIELTVEQSHPALRSSASAAFSVEVEGAEQLVVACEVERSYLRNLESDEVTRAIRQSIWKQHDLKVYAALLLKTGSIPKTSSGKIQRQSCKAGFLGESLDVLYTSYTNKDDALDDLLRLNPSAPSQTPITNSVQTVRLDNKVLQINSIISTYTAQSIENWLAEWITNQLEVKVQTIESHKSFAEYGLDSVTAVRLTSDFKSWLGRELSSSITWDYPTIATLAQHLTQELDISAPTESVGIDEVSQTAVRGETFVGKELELDYKFSNGNSSLVQDLNGSEIPPEYYNFHLYPEYRNLKHRIEEMELMGNGNPYFKVHERICNDTTVIDGQELINYSSYNYLGMSGDPVVTSAAKEAIERYGTSVSASRVVSGEKPLHRELERELANFVGSEDCIVYVGGHATNVTTISHLFGSKDLILHDSLIHNSISEGCALSGAKILSFPHNNWQALDKLLCEQRYQFQRVLVVIEGVYSVDGDIPDLPKFLEVKKRHKVFLMIDEAHSIGVLGNHGCGIGEYFGVNPTDVDLWMGTLSKSFASCGGYIAGSKALVEYLKYTAPGFIFSVGISPANAAAALAAIKLLKTQPERVACLHERAKLFLELARERKLDTGRSKNTPVVPVIVGNSIQCIQLSQALFRGGINVQPMIYPTVAENAARLRFFINSTHTEEQIRFTLDVLAQEFAKVFR